MHGALCLARWSLSAAQEFRNPLSVLLVSAIHETDAEWVSTMSRLLPTIEADMLYEFISERAAMGGSVAFGAPVGGMLFSLEVCPVLARQPHKARSSGASWHRSHAGDRVGFWGYPLVGSSSFPMHRLQQQDGVVTGANCRSLVERARSPPHHAAEIDAHVSGEVSGSNAVDVDNAKADMQYERISEEIGRASWRERGVDEV